MHLFEYFIISIFYLGVKMRFLFLLLSITLASAPNIVSAQLFGIGDIEVGYDTLADPTSVVLGGVVGVSTEGIPYFTADVVVLDPFIVPTDFAADFPGFVTNPQAGLVLEPLDLLFIRVLDAREESDAAVGYVNFYNPATEQLEASGRIAVHDNSIGTVDLVLNGDSIESGEVDQVQQITPANSAGGLHRHIEFDFLDDATLPPGAYGVIAQVETDLNAVDGENVTVSEPFWIIWNHDLTPAEFNVALSAFVAPEIAPQLGDFDGDGDVDLADLDRYIGNLGSSATGDLEPLDLNTNGTVGSDDFQEHYEQLVETSNGGTGTFAGDINLDGTVDVLGDAFILVGSLGSSVTSWGDGDLNGDEVVDVLGDAFLLVGNLGNSNAPSN